MIVYIDYKKKRIFITSPKCGNNTIAAYLKCDLHMKYNDDEMNDAFKNKEFEKILIIRNPYERFLSGFYEDLLNNTCYNDINITFKEYLRFLNYCHNNKIQNVNNLNIFYKEIEQKVWWGECSGLKLPITDDNGCISGHIRNQSHYIKKYLDLFTIGEIRVIDIYELSNILQETEIKNKKTYSKNAIENGTKLCDLKLRNFKQNPNYRTNYKLLYDEEIIDIIKNIYKDDFAFINNLNKNGYNFNYEIFN
jgi:hypothetical protein